MNKTEYFLIARVHSLIGKRGYVKVISYSDFPERFSRLKKIYIDFFGTKKEFVLEHVMSDGKSYSFKIQKFDNPGDAEIFLGKDIFVDQDDLLTLPENCYYIHDLIGSIVLRNGEKFGHITDVMQLKSNDVLVIQTIADKEILLPLLNEYLEVFDAGKKELTLKPGGDYYVDED